MLLKFEVHAMPTHLLRPVHTSNNVEATLSNATMSNVASTKSNVASTLLLVWTGLKSSNAETRAKKTHSWWDALEWTEDDNGWWWYCAVIRSLYDDARSIVTKRRPRESKSRAMGCLPAPLMSVTQLQRRRPRANPRRWRHDVIRTEYPTCSRICRCRRLR